MLHNFNNTIKKNYGEKKIHEIVAADVEWKKARTNERRMWQCLFLLYLFVCDFKVDKTEWSTMNTIRNGTTSITKKEKKNAKEKIGFNKKL